VCLCGNVFLYLHLQLAGSDLVSLLSNPSLRPFTLFAPNDFAFNQPNSIPNLLLPGNDALLESFVTYHIISGARVSVVCIVISCTE